MTTYHIRLVELQDNATLKQLVIETLTEFGCVGSGFASSDPEIEDMHATYQEPGSAYWVIENTLNNTVVGGGGFSRLRGTTEAEGICELQKLYFSQELRGKGMAKPLMALILKTSREMGYQTMYLETVPAMTTAIRLYEQLGFHTLDGPMGCTGHSSCPVHMALQLQ